MVGAAWFLFMLTIVARVNEYAAGPALVRLDSRTELPATSDGVVGSVAVRAGQRVAAGEVLLQYVPVREVDELGRLHREIDVQIGISAAGAAPGATDEHLGALQRQRAVATAHLAERSIVAPYAGTVEEVRVHPGQRISAGDVVLSIADAHPSFSVIALLPGQFRPLLHPGDKLRLDLAGYRYNSQRITIHSVGERVLGPSDVRRLLGEEAATSLGATGPVIVVRARLPAAGFMEEGHMLGYYDGMPAAAEVRVRSQPVLFALIPALRGWI